MSILDLITPRLLRRRFAGSSFMSARAALMRMQCPSCDGAIDFTTPEAPGCDGGHHCSGCGTIWQIHQPFNAEKRHVAPHGHWLSPAKG